MGIDRGALVEMIVVNNDPSKTLWVTYYGLDPADGLRPAHLADAAGTLAPNTPSAEPTDALSLPVVAGSSFVLPMLSAARLYVSVGHPLRLTVDVAGNPIPPQSANPADVNHGTPWDFFEVTYVPVGPDGLFNLNLSNVQSANLPLAFHVVGSDPSTREPVDYSRGWVPGCYADFLDALRGNPDFAGLVLPDTDRVLAPGTAITAYAQKVIPVPLFDADYLGAYVAEVWARFEGVDLTFVGDPPPGSNTFVTWTGRVADGRFTFTTTDLPLEPIVLDPPSTSDLFENNFNFCASGRGAPGSLQENYALQLFGTLCAAFNRSVMLTTTTLANSSDCEWCKAKGSFYQDPTTNHYAKQVHANTVGWLAYAFQSDDHCDVSSFVSVVNPSHLTISLVAPA